VAEVKEFAREYQTCAVFRFTKKVARPEARFAWTRKVNSKLLNLEREVFLSGYYKTFLLFMDSCQLLKNAIF
jgi:predicted metal-binding protein